VEAKKTYNHFIIGTAGHVDHGKTALVKALTNIDCDTHPEEKLRGITINLGFAHLDFPNGTSVGIVDVPGHRDFINTMVSGACGIDFALLIIAADSSVMPQTIEHLHILQMLGVSAGCVIITKTDLVDEEMLMIVEEDVKDLVKNTFLEACVILKVSSVNRQGVDELKEFLSKQNFTKQISGSSNLFRMFIDRIFSVSGFGSVVTGSVLSGHLKLEDKVYLLPAGKELRVRRLEKHGKEVNEVIAGNRAAINLTGLKKEEFNKGMVLCDRVINPTKIVDVKLEIIRTGKKMEMWSHVLFLLATYESHARVHLLDSDRVKCGEHAIAQIHLDAPLIAQIGDKFIIRNSSNDITLGGGEIIDPYPLHHRKRTEKLIEQLKKISTGDVQEHIAAEIRKYHSPVTLDCIANNLNLSKNELSHFTVELLPEDISYFNSDGTFYFILSDQLGRLKNRIIRVLENYHKQNSLDEDGKSFEELMGIFGIARNPASEGVMKSLLKEMIKTNILRTSNATWKLFSHNVLLSEEDKMQIKFVEDFHKKHQMNTPLMSELIPQANNIGIFNSKLEQILRLLVNRKILYNIDGNYIHSKVVDKCRKSLVDFLNARQDGITVAQFRDLVNGNRKICLLLLVQFDREGTTYRDGDLRFLIKQS
jgi:selenocysteine-specific elongation factor